MYLQTSDRAGLGVFVMVDRHGHIGARGGVLTVRGVFAGDEVEAQPFVVDVLDVGSVGSAVVIHRCQARRPALGEEGCGFLEDVDRFVGHVVGPYRQ